MGGQRFVGVGGQSSPELWGLRGARLMLLRLDRQSPPRFVVVYNCLLLKDDQKERQPWLLTWTSLRLLSDRWFDCMFLLNKLQRKIDSQGSNKKMYRSVRRQPWPTPIAGYLIECVYYSRRSVRHQKHSTVASATPSRGLYYNGCLLLPPLPYCSALSLEELEPPPLL